MDNRRDRFASFLARWTGGADRPRAIMTAGSGSQSTDLVFIGAVVVALAVSAGLVWLVTGPVLQYLIAAIWGVVFGGTMLYFVPDKLLVMLMGGIIGTGAADLAGLGQIFEKTSQLFLRVTELVGTAGSTAVQPLTAWIFFGLIFLFCIPAYRGESPPNAA
jgi:hypothetical protein